MPTIKSDSDLVAALREAGIPQRAIATRLSLPPSAVSNIFSGTRGIRFEEAAKLLEMLPLEQRGNELPLIGMAGAGSWIDAVEVTRRHITVPAELRGRFATEIVGTSMNLLMPEGSIAIVDPDDTTLYVGKIYLLINEDGEGTVKRFRADPARFEPVSDDPSHVPFEVGSQPFRVVGRVSGAVQIF